MSRRFFLPAMAALVLVGLVGCDAADTGDDDAQGGPDATLVGDGGLPEGAVGPHGTQVLVSSDISIDGVTSDGYAIYTDNSSNTLYAVPLTGTPTPVTLGPLGTTSAINVVGPAVVFWAALNANNVGALSVWTRTNGSVTLATSSLAGTFAVDADGTHVLYVDGVAAGGADGTLFASTSAGAKTELAASMMLADPCAPQLAFAGTYALAAYCAAEGDGGAIDAGGADAGTAVATISSFPVATWQNTTLATLTLPQFAVNTAATEVLVSVAGGLSIYPIAGGAAKVIDGSGNFGTLTSDGQDVIYTTTLNSLKRSPVAAANPVVLVSSGLSTIQSLSPNNATVLANLNTDSTTGYTDLYLASATTPGAAMTLSATTTASLVGSSFTADSSHALYFTNVANDIGTFTAFPSTGGSAVVLGKNAYTCLATSGAKVLFNVNYDATNGTADLEAVDTSKTAPPTLLVTQADGDFYLTPAKDMIVYTWSYVDSAAAGLWTMPVP